MSPRRFLAMSPIIPVVVNTIGFLLDEETDSSQEVKKTAKINTEITFIYMRFILQRYSIYTILNIFLDKPKYGIKQSNFKSQFDIENFNLSDFLNKIA